MKAIKILVMFLMLGGMTANAQIGEHRNDFSIGVNGGYLMSSVGFTPSIPQSQHGGLTGGFSFRYVCEKYFKSICSVYGEVNFAQAGWKEKILDIENAPVIITNTGEPMAYERTISYVQVPIFAHLAWGRVEHPVAVEHIQAAAGMDIGDTLIGMHLRDVAVPVRLRTGQIGDAHVVCARTRPKFIGGGRAVYDEELM